MSRSRVDATSVIRRRRQGSISPGIVITLSFGVLGLLAMLAYLYLGAGPGNFTVGLVLALLPVPFLVAAVLLLDRLKPQPFKLLATAFLWGAGLATLASLVVNTFGSWLAFVVAGGQDTQNKLEIMEAARTAEMIGAAGVAPVVEECFKGLVLLGFLFFRRRRLTSLTDGIILAALVGLGFAWVENVLYYVNIMGAGQEALAECTKELPAAECERLIGSPVTGLFILRGLITPLLHPLFTAMTGIAVAAAAMTRGPGRFLLPPLGWLGAVILHAMWNGSSFVGGPLPIGLPAATLAVYGFDFLLLIGIVVLVIRERHRIVAAVARYLPPYIPTGLVTPADINMLSSMGARRQARDWASQVAGPPGKKAMAGYQLTAVELAAMHRQVEKGVPDAGWPLLRDAYLMHMDQARQTFQRRAPHPAAPAWTGSANDTGFLSRAALNVPPPPPPGGAGLPVDSAPPGGPPPPGPPQRPQGPVYPRRGPVYPRTPQAPPGQPPPPPPGRPPGPPQGSPPPPPYPQPRQRPPQGPPGPGQGQPPPRPPR